SSSAAAPNTPPSDCRPPGHFEGQNQEAHARVPPSVTERNRKAVGRSSVQRPRDPKAHPISLHHRRERSTCRGPGLMGYILIASAACHSIRFVVSHRKLLLNIQQRIRFRRVMCDRLLAP